MLTNNIETVVDTSRALQDVFYKYTHLPIGGKEIVCPYWMNNLKRGVYGIGGGKGTPEEIVKNTLAEAESQNVDLKSFSISQIVEFMQTNKIGIDCSGFGFWMLNALDWEKGGNGLADNIPGCVGKTIKTRANVKMLTDENVSYFIETVGKIQPGDMFRFRGGKHIAIVLSIIKDAKNNLKEIIYAHSSSSAYCQTSGVHSNKIIIVNPDLDLKQQEWLEKTNNGLNYSQNIWPDRGDGVKRLKIWSK